MKRKDILFALFAAVFSLAVFAAGYFSANTTLPEPMLIVESTSTYENTLHCDPGFEFIEAPLEVW